MMVHELELKLAFNSLSRDHRARPEAAAVPADGKGLSTPSLGITLNKGEKKLSKHCCCFQLPLSGSQKVLGLNMVD